MNEPNMPDEARREWMSEEARHIKAFVAFIHKWPNFRKHAAYGLLGGAIARADAMGCDVETFIAELRARESKPNVLVPPRGS